MKGKINMILLIAVLAYLMLLFDFNLEYQYKSVAHKIEYNGLIWVGLDYYTIIKYHSPDKPMKWLRHLRTDIKAKPKGCTSLIFPDNCHKAGCMYCNRYNDFKASL